ncbi:hypothetical protein ACFVVA_37070 [Kitasatospora sp. NPDC058048]|uniref:hypothetical protein n=1 Tax=Kitasatospora sp. NPDC058048 TaxID=3346313 RepID=UPI0036D82B9A
MQLRTTSPGKPDEPIAVVGPEPGTPVWKYADADLDVLALFDVQIPGIGPGVRLRTDPHGCSVALDDIPYLIDALQRAATLAQSAAQRSDAEA